MNADISLPAVTVTGKNEKHGSTRCTVVPAVKTHMFSKKNVFKTVKRPQGFRGRYLTILGINEGILYVKRYALARQVTARKDSIDKASGKPGHLVERLFNTKLKLQFL